MDHDREREAEAQREYTKMLDNLAEGPLHAEFVTRLTAAAGVTPAQFKEDFAKAKVRRDQAALLKWRERAGVDRR